MMTTKNAVLKALEDARGNRISGGMLAKKLNISRAAVWKAIDSLRADGLQIDAVTGEGYCLLSEDDSLTSAGINALLSTKVFGKEILVVPTITSTNSVLKTDFIDKPHGFTLVSEEQTGGRGRLGRAFVSPAETGVYFSILLHPDLPIEKVVFLTISAAIAVSEAIAETAHFSPEIKWVNDIFMQNKKLCGILTEANIEGETGAVTSVIVGIGINLRANPNLPNEVIEVAGALSDFGTVPRRAALVASVLSHFEALYATLENGNTDELLKKYRSRLCCLNQKITVISPSKKYNATCIDINENANLIVLDEEGEKHVLSSGEISIRL